MPFKAKKETLDKILSNSNLVLGTQSAKNTRRKHPKKVTKSKPVVKHVVDFNSFRSSLMGKKLYKSLTIVRGKEWYVQFYYSDPENPSIFKPVRTRGGLNRVRDINEREKLAQDLMRDVRRWLDGGNVPQFALKKVIESIVEKDLVTFESELDKTWTLGKAISEYRIYLNSHGYSERTMSTYKCYVDDLEEWLKEYNLLENKANQFTELDLLPLLDEASADNDWSSRTYNNNLEFFGNLFNRCKKLEKEKTKNRGIRYEFNITDIDPKITNAQVNKAYSPLLAKKIKEELDKPGNELLRDYVEWLYLSLMRPREMRNLKVQDIDTESRQIRIIGKTGDRIIPIGDQLLKLINKKGLLNQGLNMYVFGKALKTSFDRMGINYPLEKYAIIKKSLNLDDVYKIYSWKPTGVIKLINAGFSDKEIMVLTGHKTESAFEKYKRDLVIDNKHVMKGKTIDF